MTGNKQITPGYDWWPAPTYEYESPSSEAGGNSDFPLPSKVATELKDLTNDNHYLSWILAGSIFLIIYLYAHPVVDTEE